MVMLSTFTSFLYRKLLRGSLRRRHLVVFLSASLIPLLLVSALIIQQQVVHGGKQILAQLESVATLKEREVEAWRSGLQSYLALVTEINPATRPWILQRLTSAAPGPRKAPAFSPLREQLQRDLGSIKIFDEFFLLSATGVVVESTNTAVLGEFRGIQEYYHKGLLHEGVHVQSLSYSSRTEVLNTVVVVMPIRSDDGQALGVLCGRASLDQLKTLMLERTGLGETGETLLIGENHLLLSNSRFGGYPAGATYIQTEGIRQALMHHADSAGFYRDYRNEMVAVVYHWLPDLHIVLLAKQDRREAYQGIYRSIQISLAIALLAVAGAAWLSIAFSRRIVGAVTDLAGMARRIAAGDLSLQIKSDSDDELGLLGRTFNEMAQRLSDGMLAIQSRVEELSRTEHALQISLRDKEALLKEVHHRVKNNLQVITSLLRLEAGRSVCTETRASLKDMQGRILAMALLHEALYVSGNFTGVDLSDYLKKLANQMLRTIVDKPGDVHLDLALLPARVEMEQAIPCGLIVNELISNCCKHAFPDGRTGEIRIELGYLDGGPQLALRVSDNGVGLPADFSQRREKTLGLELVSDLAGQLGGQLTIGPGPGSVFIVTFTPKGNHE